METPLPSEAPVSHTPSGMIAGMTTKITVSLPDALVAAARRAVREGQAASVSSYVANAMSSFQGRDTLQDMLDEMDAIYGPVGEEAMAWAREVTDRVDRENAAAKAKTEDSR